MNVVYILVNEDQTKTYVGSTINFERRLLEHQKGQTPFTKNFGKFSSNILESCPTITAARRREKYYRSAAGRRKIKELFKC